MKTQPTGAAAIPAMAPLLDARCKREKLTRVVVPNSVPNRGPPGCARGPLVEHFQ
jgi:hypothetical protein